MSFKIIKFPSNWLCHIFGIRWKPSANVLVFQRAQWKMWHGFVACGQPLKGFKQRHDTSKEHPGSSWSVEDTMKWAELRVRNKKPMAPVRTLFQKADMRYDKGINLENYRRGWGNLFCRLSESLLYHARVWTLWPGQVFPFSQKLVSMVTLSTIYRTIPSSTLLSQFSSLFPHYFFTLQFAI